MSRRPSQLFLLILAVVFCAEALVMLALGAMGRELKPWDALLDAGMLSLVIAPAIYGLVFLPLTRQRQALAEREQWLASITDHIPEALVVIDAEGAIRMFNPAAERMFGRTAAEVLGRNVGLLMPPEEAARHDEYIRRYLATGEARVLGKVREQTAMRADGSRFPIEIQVREIRGRGRRFFLGLIRDLTGKKEAEAERQRVRERMERVQRLESLGVLAGGIAHDFNNLLAAIQGNAELLRLEAPELSEPARECLDNIERGCSSAADLCRQMLAYAGKGRFQVGLVPIGELVRGMDRLIRVSVPKAIEIVEEVPDSLPPVHADRAQIEQVILNLVTNAAEAIGEAGGEIRLRGAVVELGEDDLTACEGGDEMKPGAYVMLEVRDTGCGIPPEVRERMFEPFFTTKFTGRGLGMSAILGILRAHGGGIEVRSTMGRGTTMRVYLPVAEGAEPVSIGPRQDETDEEAPLGQGPALIVDDEQALRCVACKMLERMGFSPLTAESGEFALDVLERREGRVALVLLDLTMPGMGGEEVLARIRKRWPRLPVILTTGYGDRALERDWEGGGPDAFVSKPFRMRELRAAVREALGNRPD